MKNIAFSEFVERLRASFDDLSGAERKIANLILVDSDALPYETAESLAARLEVSAITVGRFCRKFGFRNFRDLKASLKYDIGALPWAERADFERLSKQTGHEALANDLQIQIANLTAAYTLAHGEIWDCIVASLVEANTIHIAGFQTERGIALHFCSLLQYARPGVRFSDLSSGHFADILVENPDPTRDCIVIVETRRYSQQARELARRASQAGMTVIIATDRYCEWAPTLTPLVLALPSGSGLFWTTMVPLVAILTLLADAVVLKIGPQAVNPRLETISELFQSFTGHVDSPGKQ